MLKNIHTEHITKKVLFALRWTGENVFLGFLVLLLIALVFSSAVFYKYVFSLNEEEVASQGSESNFRNATFQAVIVTWEERARAFEEVTPAAHRDIFSPSFQSAEEEPDEEPLTEE